MKYRDGVEKFKDNLRYSILMARELRLIGYSLKEVHTNVIPFTEHLMKLNKKNKKDMKLMIDVANTGYFLTNTKHSLVDMQNIVLAKTNLKGGNLNEESRFYTTIRTR